MPDYGIDAPGIRRTLLIVCAIATLLVGAAFATVRGLGGPLRTVATVVGCVGSAVAAQTAFLATYMTWSSRVGKLRTREAMLDDLRELRGWSGAEAVLDIGCGRGLLVCGAARRLTTGRAIGVDIWRAEDQSGNDPSAARTNAEREGVAQRVRIETADMRALPFSDATFDAVVSHWAIHNIDDASERKRALDEIVRVVKPGGAIAIDDIQFVEAYAAQLRARGFEKIRVVPPPLVGRIAAALSFGSYDERRLIALRPIA